MVTPSASCTLKSKVPGNWSLVHQVIYDSLPFCRHAVVCSNISCTNRLYWEHTESTAEQPSSFSFYVVKKQLAAISSRPHPQVFMTKETTECFLAIFQACARSASFEMFCHGMNRRCLHDTRSVNSVLNTVFTHSTGNSDVCVLIFVNEQERTCATTDTANTCQMMNNSTDLWELHESLYTLYSPTEKNKKSSSSFVKLCYVKTKTKTVPDICTQTAFLLPCLWRRSPRLQSPGSHVKLSSP